MKSYYLVKNEANRLVFLLLIFLLEASKDIFLLRQVGTLSIKSVDGVLGIRTQDCRMVGTDGDQHRSMLLHNLFQKFPA